MLSGRVGVLTLAGDAQGRVTAIPYDHTHLGKECQNTTHQLPCCQISALRRLWRSLTLSRIS